MTSSHSNLLTSDDAKDIMAEDLKHDEFFIKSLDICSLSDKIEGFLGEHYLVTIKYDLLKEPFERCRKTFFLKMLSGSSSVVEEITTSMNAFAKEDFLYNLLREMMKKEIDTSFAPKSYLTKPKILVLENLSLREYRNFPKTQFFDLAHTKQALRTVMRLHCSSFLYEECLRKQSIGLSNLYHAYPESLKSVFYDPNSIAWLWLKYSLDGVFNIIEYYYVNDEKRDRFINKLKKLFDGFGALFQGRSEYCCTILHGDVWSNNFLFKYKDQSPTDCVLVDYQTVNYGPPSFEVIHLLYTNTRRNFRNDHFVELVEFYYSSLKDSLLKCGVKNLLEKEEYLRLCEMYKPWVKLHSLCDRCMTFIPDRFVHEYVKCDDDFRKYLFEDRAMVILNCFKQEEAFRELIVEDIEELREILDEGTKV